MDQQENTREVTQWGLKDAIFGILLAIGLMIFLGVVFGFLLGIITVVLDVDVRTDVMTAALMVIELSFIIPAWLFGPHKHGGGWKALGFRSVPIGKILWMSAAGLVVTWAANLAWEPLRQALGWATQTEVPDMFGEGLVGFLAALVTVGVIAPIAEEVLFRGFLQRGFTHKWGSVAGVLVTAVLFTLFHMYPGVFPPIFVLGISFGLMRQATDSILPSIVLHAGFNTLSVVLSYMLPLLGVM